MRIRHEYSLELSRLVPTAITTDNPQLQTRAVRLTDCLSLAELMLDAYRGTIDDEGETFEEAIAEVKAYMAGERGGQPCLVCSRLAYANSWVLGACLAAESP